MVFKIVLIVTSLLAGSFASPVSDRFRFANSISPRIVNGQPAPPGSHPHMVAITTGLLIRAMHCGGSIISQRTILTAAHCLDENSIGVNRNLRAVVGSNDWRTGTEHHLSHNIIHPDYDFLRVKNDIALLFTVINIVFNNNVQPVALSYSHVGADIPVRVAGFGNIRLGGPWSNILLELDSTTLRGQDCVGTIHSVDQEKELCVLGTVGYGVCHGDSGSALRRIDTGEQIGLVSWSMPCAVGAPDVYARVSAYQNFIESNKI